MPVWSSLNRRAKSVVPSITVHHNPVSSAVLDTATGKITIDDYVHSIVALQNGGFHDKFKPIPKSLRGHLHTILSTLQGAPKGALKMKISDRCVWPPFRIPFP